MYFFPENFPKNTRTFSGHFPEKYEIFLKIFRLYITSHVMLRRTAPRCVT